MPGGLLLAAYVLKRMTEVDENRLMLPKDEKAEEEEQLLTILFFASIASCSR